MTATALLRHGPEHVDVLLGGLVDWMTRKGFGTVRDMRGLLALPANKDETAYERHGYVRCRLPPAPIGPGKARRPHHPD